MLSSGTSSSVRAMLVPVTVRLPDSPVTLIVSSASSRASSVGVRSKALETLASPAGMTRSKADTRA